MFRVLRWEVPVDSEWHDIGAGAVVHVAARYHQQQPGDLVEVWTLEATAVDGAGSDELRKRSVIAVGTGHAIPFDNVEHLGSAVVPTFDLVPSMLRGGKDHVQSRAGLIWHLFAKYPAPRVLDRAPQIGGFKRGNIVTIGANGDQYEGQTGVVTTLDHDHGWRLWVRVGVDVHDQHAPALYLSPDDLDMVVVS